MKTLVHIILILGLFILPITGSYADPSDPPTPNNEPGANGNPVGAPIDGGLGILLALGLGYGGMKLYKAGKIGEGSTMEDRE